MTENQFRSANGEVLSEGFYFDLASVDVKYFTGKYEDDLALFENKKGFLKVSPNLAREYLYGPVDKSFIGSMQRDLDWMRTKISTLEKISDEGK